MNRLGCQLLSSAALTRDQDRNGAVTHLVDQPQDGVNFFASADDILRGELTLNLVPELGVFFLKLVAMPLHLLHELRRFNGNRRLGRQCLQYFFVIPGECPGLFIQYLKGSDDLPFMVSQRYREKTLSAISSAKVDLPIKARIAMRMLDINGLSRQGDRSGDAQASIKTYLFTTKCDLRPELTSFAIQQKKGGSIGLH